MNDRRRAKPVAAERETLKALPKRRTTDFAMATAKVTRNSTINVDRVIYSVPSRLIGHCFLGPDPVMHMTRVRTDRKRGHSIDYHHLIGTLRRKPHVRFQAAISNLVDGCARPKNSIRRGKLIDIHNVGEAFLNLVNDDLLSRLFMGDEAFAGVERVCAYAASEAARMDVSQGRSKRITSHALKNFLWCLVDMGKGLGLRPTGAINVANAERGKLPPFHRFAREAIRVAGDIIKSSPGISEQRKDDAFGLLYFQSDRSRGYAFQDVLKQRKVIDDMAARSRQQAENREATGGVFIPPWRK